MCCVDMATPPDKLLRWHTRLTLLSFGWSNMDFFVFTSMTYSSISAVGSSGTVLTICFGLRSLRST